MELTGWRLVLNVALAAMTRLSRHHVRGSGGCNRLMGSYEAKGAQLTFSQMATTRMACAQGMDTEKALVEALATVKGWKITGQQLELLEGDGQVVASFVRRAAK
jgi:heat shock protein HslJ